MKKEKILAILLVISLITMAGCTFIGGVFKTGVGVGVFIVVALIVIVLMISRRSGRGV